MKTLYLDIGNTRTKYRINEGQTVISRGFCKIDDLRIVISNSVVEKAFVSSVADEGIREKLTLIFNDATIEKVFWAATEKQFGDVKNAYSDYQSLGVDRWLAIIAAYYKFRKPCCIFDFGSAVTVDYVDQRGCHLGGYIVPGSALSIAALKQNTAALKPASKLSQQFTPGMSTESCIQNGIYLQQSGFAQAVFKALTDELIVCTGGGFAQVEKVFEDQEYAYVPDLVLDGLQIVSSGR